MRMLTAPAASAGALLLAAVLAIPVAVAQQAAPAQPAAAVPQGQPQAPAARPRQPLPKDAADLDLRAFQRGMNRQPSKPFDQMTALEVAQFTEEYGMEMRQRALAFLSLYPNDPRRWNIIDSLNGQMPGFVLQWGEPDAAGAVRPLAVDEAAATAWKEQVKSLQAQMAAATDVPEHIKRMKAMMAEAEARQKAMVIKWSSGQQMAPDFTMQTLENTPVKISDYRGKVVILDFWASWCGPCKAAMPHVQKLAAQYKDQGVVVIGSGTQDARAAFETFVKANKEKYPDIIWAHDKEEQGENRPSKVLYDVEGIPAQFVIGRDGKVVQLILGYMPGEVVLDGALARAGIKVDAAIVEKAAAELKNRSM